jgi:hypothetical protein
VKTEREMVITKEGALKAETRLDRIKTAAICLGRTLFPKIPSEKVLKARRQENGRRIVGLIGSRGDDGYLLSRGRYLTEDGLNEKRRLLGLPERSYDE